MPEIDVAQLQEAVAALQKDREYQNLLRAGFSERAQELANRRAVATSLEQSLVKTGLDLTELDRLARKNRAELRHVVETGRTEAFSRVSAEDIALRRGLEGRRQALQQLAALPTSLFVPTFITLDKPFLITQLPQASFDQLVDWHIESLFSWARISISTHVTVNTSFHFFFMWENVDPDYWAVVNVLSPLILNGSYDAYADTGIVSGDSTQLYSLAELTPIEWWNQPPTSPYREQSEFTILPQLYAHGGWFGDSQAHDGFVFPSVPFDLKYDLFAVPPSSVAIFDVSLSMYCSFGLGNQDNNYQNEVVAEFSNVDLGHHVLCPFVQLELLTKPPSAS